MKTKYVIYADDGFDADRCCVTYNTLKTFRNEPDALAFYNNPKNQRMYRSLYMERHEESGVFEWNERRECWERLCPA